MNSPVRFVYSDAYEVDVGAHVFPTVKFRLIHERLIHEGLIAEEDFLRAPCASDKELMLVHTRPYLNKLRYGTLSLRELHTLELPYSQALVRAARICAGGTILAAKVALREKRPVFHLGGGFHHAFADHGEGFCMLNDVACAVKFCRLLENPLRIMIVDCDLHQGNANAEIFKDCRNIFTFSIHQQNNYPLIKPRSDLDIGLADGTEDKDYLDALRHNLTQALMSFRPQLIFYIAGADPYREDQLGGLCLSIEGLRERDEFVFNITREIGSLLVIVLGGGYARRLKDTVEVHYNTVKKALEVFNGGR